MKIKRLIFLTILIVGANFNTKAQQINYTTAETYAIRDSIQKSRWDIGGNLSKYSFRYMSEFFQLV